MENLENNENYKLLELSDRSDSEVDLPDFINLPRKKKTRRKARRLRNDNYIATPSRCTCNIWTVTVLITILLLTTWIISLTWLAVIFHNELQRLDNSYRGVVASSQGVPDALQKCHTISKNLQQNQTVMSVQIVDLKVQMENLSKEVASVQSELNKIQEKFNNAPEYLNIPQQISEVSGSVANLGSQIKDLTTTVSSLKESKGAMEKTSNTLLQNVTSLQQSVTNLQNMTQQPIVLNEKSNAEMKGIMKVVDEIKINVTNLNSTFSNKIQWLYDDQFKDRKMLDLLSETSQNISAKVTTLEGICGKSTSEQITLRSNVSDITKELSSLTTRVQSIAMQIPTLQSQFRHLSENSSEIQAQVQSLVRTTATGSPSPYSIIDTPTTTQLAEDTRSATPPSNHSSTAVVNSGKPTILEAGNGAP